MPDTPYCWKGFFTFASAQSALLSNRRKQADLVRFTEMRNWIFTNEIEIKGNETRNGKKYGLKNKLTLKMTIEITIKVIFQNDP